MSKHDELRDAYQASLARKQVEGVTEPPNTEVLLTTVREVLRGCELSYQTRALFPQAKNALAALDAIASERERYKREAHDWQDHADELSERYTAELERVRAERDYAERGRGTWKMVAEKRAARLDRAVEALRKPPCNNIECERTDHLTGAARAFLAEIEESGG